MPATAHGVAGMRTMAGRGLVRRRVLAGGLATLAAGFPLRAAWAAPGEADPRLDAGYVMAELGPGRALRGYLVRQKAGEGRLPGIVVLHDAEGLGPPARDTARRLALEGFLAFAPDMLTPAGGTPPDPAAAMGAVARLSPDAAAADAADAARWLAAGRRTSGGVALIGFGWGGGVANRAALSGGRGIRASIAYYGTVPSGRGPPPSPSLLLHLAGRDPAVNRAAAGWVRAVQQAGGTVTAFYYPTAAHGFAEAGTPAHDAAAERLAWSRTIAFLQRELA